VSRLERLRQRLICEPRRLGCGTKAIVRSGLTRSDQTSPSLPQDSRRRADEPTIAFAAEHSRGPDAGSRGLRRQGGRALRAFPCAKAIARILAQLDSGVAAADMPASATMTLNRQEHGRG
jgi:hypothetical protein